MEVNKRPSLSAKKYNKTDSQSFEILSNRFGFSDSSAESTNDCDLGVPGSSPIIFNQMSQVTYTTPRLYDANGDTSKEWFVFFYCLSPLNKWVRFRKTEGFSKIKSIEQRIIHGNMLCMKYEAKLKSGWDPFKDRRRSLVANGIEEYAVAASPQMRLNYWLNLFIERKSNELRDKSISTYKSKIKVFLQWIQQNRYNHLLINRFPENVAREFIDYLHNGRFSRNTIKPKTRNSYLQTLETAWNWIILQNPELKIINHWQKIPRMKVSITRKITYTENQRKLIWSYLENNDLILWIVVRLVYKTFIRPGREMRGITVGDIDLIENKIWIREEIAKNKKTQWVPLPIDVKQKLIEIGINKYPLSFYAFGYEGPQSDPVGRDYYSKQFRKVLEKLNIGNGVSLYTMKHTGNQVAHIAGMPLKKQQELNRHHSLDQMDVYLSGIAASNCDELEQYFKD